MVALGQDFLFKSPSTYCDILHKCAYLWLAGQKSLRQIMWNLFDSWQQNTLARWYHSRFFVRVGHEIKPHNNLPENFIFFQYTGSTIRNWDKVNTCVDQMFWQIYQKLKLSDFLSSGNLLCLVFICNFFDLVQSSTEKNAKIQHEFSWFCRKYMCSKHQKKNLKNSLIFPTLKCSCFIDITNTVSESL